jgi:hypothetical protein
MYRLFATYRSERVKSRVICGALGFRLMNSCERSFRPVSTTRTSRRFACVAKSDTKVNSEAQRCDDLRQPDLSTLVTRVQALTNMLKHAGATTAELCRP